MNNSDAVLDFLFLLFVLCALIILISIQFKGILYDAERKKIDKNYKGNHSFSSRTGSVKVYYWFPIPIFFKSENENLHKLTNQMNNRIILFWLLIATIIIIYKLKS